VRRRGKKEKEKKKKKRKKKKRGGGRTRRAPSSMVTSSNTGKRAVFAGVRNRERSSNGARLFASSSHTYVGYPLVSVSLKPAVGKTDAVGLNPTELITYRSSEPPLVAVGLKSAVGLLQTRKQRVSNSVGYNVVAHRLGFRVPPRLHQRHGTEVEGVRVRLVACRTQRRCQLLARLALPGPRQRPPRLPHSDAKSANRDIRVWHFVMENGY
jgi:hypothetical protein